MPVITLYYDRLLSHIKSKSSNKKNLSNQDIVETLPYLGLDIEEETEEYVKIEYNPNRPDFSSEWGISRALNGLLGLEKGAPEYQTYNSNVFLNVDSSVLEIRPVFVGALVKGLKLDDESVRQLMVMQDDLDNGIGRKRSKVSTGIHDFDKVKPPFTYKAVKSNFEFTPLGYNEKMSLSRILKEVETGRKYKHIVEGFSKYPIIIDKEENVLSFPPIINGSISIISVETKNLFIDVTSTNLKSAEDVLAVILAALHDKGGRIESVEVRYPTYSKIEPELKSSKMKVEPKLINKLLGLDLNSTEIIECLARSRISAEVEYNYILASIPRYRSDILHPVDLVEEVIIGFNILNLTTTLPETSHIGKLNPKNKFIDSIRNVLIALGLIEVMNFSFVNKETIINTTNSEPSQYIRVENPKTVEHEYLRDSLISSLLMTLERNIHEEYPQRIFEVGKVFTRKTSNESKEEYRVAVAIAHTNANYTEAKSYLEAFLNQLSGLSCETKHLENKLYIHGRGATIEVRKNNAGTIGEVAPEVLEAFSLRVPVSIFELSIEEITKT